LIKYIKSVLWRVAKRLSYTEDTWCLKVKGSAHTAQYTHLVNAVVVVRVVGQGWRLLLLRIGSLCSYTN